MNEIRLVCTNIFIAAWYLYLDIGDYDCYVQRLRKFAHYNQKVWLEMQIIPSSTFHVSALNCKKYSDELQLKMTSWDYKRNWRNVICGNWPIKTMRIRLITHQFTSSVIVTLVGNTFLVFFTICSFNHYYTSSISSSYFCIHPN